MKIITILVILVLIPNELLCQVGNIRGTTDSLYSSHSNTVNDSLQHSLDLIQMKNKELESRIDSQIKLYDSSFTIISTQLSTINTFIAVGSLFFAVASIFLAVYITKIQNRTSELLTDTLAAKKEVENIQKNINENFDIIYANIKEKELQHALEDLRKNPDKIFTYSSMLNISNLDDRHYNSLKNIVEDYSRQIDKDLLNDPIAHKVAYYLAILNENYAEKLFKNESLINIIKLNWRYFIPYPDEKGILKFFKNFAERINSKGIYEDELRKFSSNLQDPLFDYTNSSAEAIYNNLKSKAIKSEIIDKSKVYGIDIWNQKFQELYNDEYKQN